MQISDDVAETHGLDRNAEDRRASAEDEGDPSDGMLDDGHEASDRDRDGRRGRVDQIRRRKETGTQRDWTGRHEGVHDTSGRQ